MKKLTLGSDPEFFFTKNGEPFPVCGLIGGTKDEPKETPFGGILEDNTQAEIVHPPVNVYATDGLKQWLEVLNNNLDYVSYLATTVGMELDRIRSSYRFDGEVLDHFGKQARQFGCVPDYNAYTGRRNPSPSAESNLRTNAGHVHLGYDCDQDDFDAKCEFVKYLDHVVGRWCVANDPDLTRMIRYGQAGAFRPKPYGLEYRVPSNFWLQNDDNMTRMFELCKQAYEMYTDGAERPKGSDIQAFINSAGVAA